jgi:hypothetical protein
VNFREKGSRWGLCWKNSFKALIFWILEFPQIEGVLAVYPHFIQLPKLQFCNIVQSCKPQLLSPLSTRSFSRSISKDNFFHQHRRLWIACFDSGIPSFSLFDFMSSLLLNWWIWSFYPLWIIQVLCLCFYFVSFNNLVNFKCIYVVCLDSWLIYWEF